MSGVKGKSGVYTRTLEYKRKVSEKMKGNIPWNKGKIGLRGWKHTKEARLKMSKAKMGNKNNLGRKFSIEHRRRLSQSARHEKKVIFGKVG